MKEGVREGGREGGSEGDRRRRKEGGRELRKEGGRQTGRQGGWEAGRLNLENEGAIGCRPSLEGTRGVVGHVGRRHQRVHR